MSSSLTPMSNARVVAHGGLLRRGRPGCDGAPANLLGARVRIVRVEGDVVYITNEAGALIMTALRTCDLESER